jgi:lipopolysaccharide transport system ATP-binding protein
MIAIQAENISKKYILKHKTNNTPTNFKEAILATFKKNKQKTSSNEEFWALKNVGFEINAGDRLGVVGANGAGKSTLLKILSRITEPTTGRITINGRVASLLEVGTGFHQELSGRENIYLNGAILGMSRQEINKKFDEIVAFSGVERFLDTPVKRYSSGMYVRLGFSIAAHLEPDILIVDEVLAVGDSDFQKKCLGKMKEVSSQGRTILFVSHNLTAVESLCNKAIFLKSGQILDDGPVKKVINSYLTNYSKNELNRSWANLLDGPGNEHVRFTKLEILPQYLPKQQSIDVRTGIHVIVEFKLLTQTEQVNLSLFLNSLTGETVFNVPSAVVPGKAGYFRALLNIPAHLLNDGSYAISVMIVKDTTAVLHFYEDALQFEIADWRPDHGDWYGKWPGVVRPSLDFSLTPDPL